MTSTHDIKPKVSAFQVRKASVLAPADPRTIRKVLRGESVSPMVEERIRRALRAMGLEHAIPKAGDAA